MAQETVQIEISGKKIDARKGTTIVAALWENGLAEQVRTGCDGGVCGACTVTVRFADGRPGKTDLACMRPVEEGMQVFPCPVPEASAKSPQKDPEVSDLQSAYPRLNRCTECSSCTSACPMGIPVMDSVLRMQKGLWPEVVEDFTTCIHCGLCRMVCEDKVEPHNMGLWVRRSIGMSKKPPEEIDRDEKNEAAEREWAYLLADDPQERLARAKVFRSEGKVPV